MSGEERRARLAEALTACRRKHGYAVPSEVDAILPVVREIVAEELRAAIADLHYASGEGYADKTTVNLDDVLRTIAARADALEAGS